MQGLAERLEREGLDVIFQIGRGEIRARAGKRAKLAGRHGHGAGAAQDIFQPDHRLAPEGTGHGVQCFGPFEFPCAAQLQMVLQVRADARHVADHGDAVLRQQARRAKAGELQHLHRADAARGEDHLGPRAGGLDLTALQVFDADGAAIRDDHAAGLGVGFDL